jgi:hypothetical protein
MGTRYNGDKNMVMRGQVYTLIAILIAVPLFMFISFYVTTSQTIKFGGMEKVVADQEHQLMDNIEDDFTRAVTISGKRAILAGINEIIRNGEYLTNASAVLEELMLNGTLEGNYSFLMADNVLSDWIDKIVLIPTGFDTSVNYDNLDVENYDGLRLNAVINLIARVSDKMNLSEISIDNRMNILISMNGLEDPIFPMNTLGLLERTIRIYSYNFYAKRVVSGSSYNNCSGNVTFDSSTPDPTKILVVSNASGITGYRGIVGEAGATPLVSCYIVGAVNAIEKIGDTINQTGYETVYLDSATGAVWSLPIREGIENGYYYYGNGPDMLQRLEGNLSRSSSDGFETFVIIPDLQGIGMQIKHSQTRISYLYFSGQTINGYQVRGLPDWFKIDTEHAGIYNLTDLLVS